MPSKLLASAPAILLASCAHMSREPGADTSMAKGADPKPLSQPIGNLDGLYVLRDGAILATVKGPADFCVMGESVYVPDLVKSEMRIIKLGM